ncbi:MAG: monovalent cation/H(+) antiporter subunit G [Thermodesulfobacteriota bacterium]
MIYLTGFLMVTGLIFMFGAAVGLIRLPDFYSRLHAAGMLDTTGMLLFIASASIYTLWQDFSLDSVFLTVKLLFIAVFIFITSPTATHAIVDAGIRAGMEPWTKKDD